MIEAKVFLIDAPIVYPLDLFSPRNTTSVVFGGAKLVVAKTDLVMVI